MHLLIYLFFCAVALLMLFVGFYDYAATKHNAATFPTLAALILSILQFSTSWNITALSGGSEFSATTSTEAYALAAFWFLIFVAALLQFFAIAFSSAKEQL